MTHEQRTIINEKLREAGATWVSIEYRILVDWGAPVKSDRSRIYDAEVWLLENIPDGPCGEPQVSFSGHREGK